MSMKLRNIPFSPPDMTEAEANEVRDAILSGWITTGPRTKKLEKIISEYVHTEKTVCLNSATAAMEMVLHLLGVGDGDEVIMPAYTYTASASVVRHVGATIKMVDVQKDCLEMDYDRLAEAITEKTKVVIPVDLAGIVCNYDKVCEVVESKKHLFRPANDIQAKIGRVVISADCAHAFGSQWHGKLAGEIADFSSFSFHAVKNFTTAEGGLSLGICLLDRRRWSVSRSTAVVQCLSSRARLGMSSSTVCVSCSVCTARIRMHSQRLSLGLGSMTSLVHGTSVI